MHSDRQAQIGGTIRIRRATPDDAPAIAQIQVDGWRTAYRGIMPDAVLDAMDVGTYTKTWTRRLVADEGTTLVATEGQDVIGWASIGRCRDADAPDEGELYAMYVAPGRWRHGAGRAMWDAIGDLLRREGRSRVAVWVLADNAPARHFYEAMGGVPDGDAIKPFEVGGTSLAAIRYWCPI